MNTARKLNFKPNYKAGLRLFLKQVVRLKLPGRYLLIELFKPLIVDGNRIISKTRNGLYFDLYLEDLIQRQIFFNLYDTKEVDFLEGLLSPSATVFDIGGNVGFYALTLAQRLNSEGKVHVFEPVHENALAIERNVKLNKLSNRIVINRIAVSDRIGEIELFTSQDQGNSGWASLVPCARRSTKVTIPTINLDAYIDQQGIQQVHLIKMDIEGAELLALEGMQRLLSSEKSPIIYFEINPFLLHKQGIEPIFLKKYLTSFGYKLYQIKSKKAVPVSPDTVEKEVCNILATK